MSRTEITPPSTPETLNESTIGDNNIQEENLQNNEAQIPFSAPASIPSCLYISGEMTPPPPYSYFDTENPVYNNNSITPRTMELIPDDYNLNIFIQDVSYVVFLALNMIATMIFFVLAQFNRYDRPVTVSCIYVCFTFLFSFLEIFDRRLGCSFVLRISVKSKLLKSIQIIIWGFLMIMLTVFIQTNNTLAHILLIIIWLLYCFCVIYSILMDSACEPCALQLRTLLIFVSTMVLSMNPDLLVLCDYP